MFRYLKAVEYKISTGDETAADELPELHATCSGLKAFATVEAHAGIEECRKACGGQGFLRSSGIADLTCSFAEPVTVEGEQVILSLQVGRFLIKSVRQMKANDPLKGSVEYLLQEPLPAMPQGSDAWMRDTPTLVALLRDRARRFALKLEARFDAAEKGGKTFDEATNANAILAYKTAGCHSSFVVARNNLRAVDEYITDEQTKAVLDRLLCLNILMRLHEEVRAALCTGEARCVNIYTIHCDRTQFAHFLSIDILHHPADT
jgi:acyl-CoA oxidase